MKNPSGSAFAFPTPRLARKIRQRKQPVQKRSTETTQALIEATLQVLRRDGFAALTTTRVAERAGVSIGTLYQYFPDKRSLVTALMVHYFELMVGTVRSAGVEMVGAPIETALRHVLRALLQVKRENLQLVLALRAPMAELDGAGFVRDTSKQLVTVTAALLRAAVPTLEHTERRASVLLTSLEGAVSHAVFENPDWLGQSWFLEELVTLSVGYVKGVRHAK